MKKKYMLIILTSVMLGVLIGIAIKDSDIKSGNYISKDRLVKGQIKITNKNIKVLNKEKKGLDKEIESLKKKHEDQERMTEINDLKEELSYTDLKESGISIKVDALNDEIGNIANFVDYNKILINIINEAKVKGGKFIAINGERINQYTEIVLAGNHININSVPVAPPYDIKIIGDMDKLSNYVDKESEYLKSVESNYPIKLEMKVEKNTQLKKMNLPNKLNHIEGE
ncbi:DUF881 domain-containing protein [Romboutsia sp.]|uniref:DUF881 domain-containing protein n=1 Tax=Romboutsia sp. TaxID=1965302 RepID=UPI003F32963C